MDMELELDERDRENEVIIEIDGIALSISRPLFDEACRVYVLEPGLTLDEREGNNIVLSHLILVAFRETLEDIPEITYDYIKTKYDNEFISAKVSYLLRQEIKDCGGNYDIT